VRKVRLPRVFLSVLFSLVLTGALGQSSASIATNAEAYGKIDCRVEWDSPAYLRQLTSTGKWERVIDKKLLSAANYKVVTIRTGDSGRYFVLTDTFKKSISIAQQDCYSADGALRFTHLEIGIPGKWFWEQDFEMTGGLLKPKRKPLYNSGDRKYILLNVPEEASKFKEEMKPNLYKALSTTPYFALLRDISGKPSKSSN
jgi:hypothetical protein